MSKILARKVVDNSGIIGNSDCLNAINTDKYVWIHDKCLGGLSFWIKSSKITWNKDKTRCYVNNLLAFTYNCDTFEICKLKKLTLVQPETATREIIVYDKIPSYVLKRYKKILWKQNNKWEKLIATNSEVYNELITAND